MPDRIAVLAAVTDLIILRRRPGGVLRVGIDGVDGSGKSVLGDELASTLRARGLTVVRASVDGFHRPASERHRRGRSSPHGYYEDSFDYGALHRELLDPLGANGSRLCRTAVYDVARECAADVTPTAVPDGSVLVLDGIFVHRPELRDVWDLSLFVRVPFEVSVPRGAGRGYGDPDPDPEQLPVRRGPASLSRVVRPRESGRHRLGQHRPGSAVHHRSAPPPGRRSLARHTRRTPRGAAGLKRDIASIPWVRTR